MTLSVPVRRQVCFRIDTVTIIREQLPITLVAHLHKRTRSLIVGWTGLLLCALHLSSLDLMSVLRKDLDRSLMFAGGDLGSDLH